jgi:hypothetical protein
MHSGCPMPVCDIFIILPNLFISCRVYQWIELALDGRGVYLVFRAFIEH